MGKGKVRKEHFVVFIIVFIILFILTLRIPYVNKSIPKPHGPPPACPTSISEATITPLRNTKHLLVSAFMDQRVAGFDIRIIGIFRRDSIGPLFCLFCCKGRLSATTATTVLPHSDNFGFPYVTTDVMCPIPKDCDATHVTLVTEEKIAEALNEIWLPIRNLKTKMKMLKYNFTVCVSNLFGGYNNVLQFAQSLEMYRLLGVDRVVIYNTSCGPELDRLLQSYIKEGFLEVVPWPIDKHLVPSHGWLHSESGGDVHYFGQQTTLNECIYRSMERSRYVLLNDIDEIIMPYQHQNLMSLMNTLRPQHPKVGVFIIENHIFPKKHFEPSGKFHLAQWEGVPGVNILEHIYRETPDRSIYHPHKLLIQPKMVEQTSVHEVLKNFGERYKIPLEVCRIIHVRTALQGKLKVEDLNVDKRLWDFSEKLISNVNRGLRRAGLMCPKGQNCSDIQADERSNRANSDDECAASRAGPVSCCLNLGRECGLLYLSLFFCAILPALNWLN